MGASKDDVKEFLAVRAPGAASSAYGPVAMDAIWSLAAAAPAPRTVLVESWWFRPRDLDHVRTAVTRLAGRPVIEVWCTAPADVTRQRYAERQRDGVHDDAERLRTDYDDWVERAEPLGLGPVLRVDTTGPVDAERLARRVRAAVCRTRLADGDRSPGTP